MNIKVFLIVSKINLKPTLKPSSTENLQFAFEKVSTGECASPIPGLRMKTASQLTPPQD